VVIVNQLSPENGSEDLAQLGEPKLVCRTSRKTLFWGFLIASLICGSGIAVLIVLLRILIADSPEDVFQNCVFFLPIGVLLLWGGTAVWRKTNRKWQVKVVVHAGGLSYGNDNTCLTCRWDEIEEVGWRVLDHYDEGVARVGGIPIYASSKHTTHRVTVRRKDGVELVFTDELDDVVALAKAIQQGIGRNIGRE
jgi:hypothetical protein